MTNNSKGRWTNPDLVWSKADETREQKPIPIRRPRPVPFQPAPAKVGPLEVLRRKRIEMTRQALFKLGEEMRETTGKIADAKARGQQKEALELEAHWFTLMDQVNGLKKGLRELEDQRSEQE